MRQSYTFKNEYRGNGVLHEKRTKELREQGDGLSHASGFAWHRPKRETGSNRSCNPRSRGRHRFLADIPDRLILSLLKKQESRYGKS
jgi:hypothetical protein